MSKIKTKYVSKHFTILSLESNIESMIMFLVSRKHSSLFSFVLFAIFCYFLASISAFDDEDHHFNSQENKHKDPGVPLPKDKVLLASVKKLQFHRNKRTTSKRTHSIHQLSCVGGTAGCKLFTPNVSNLSIPRSSYCQLDELMITVYPAGCRMREPWFQSTQEQVRVAMSRRHQRTS